MRDDGSHAACVDAWLERAARDLPPASLVALLEAAFSALWSRTELTLGAITLTAIADRVVHDAKEKHPILSRLDVGSNGGIHFDRLREEAAALDRVALLESIRFVLSEFLIVIGVLTAEILTADLHRELGKVQLKGTHS